MALRLSELRKIYAENIEIDWLVMAANIIGVLVVVAVFSHARYHPTAVGARMELADLAMDVAD